MSGAASRRQDREERTWLRGAPPPRWLRLLPLVLLVGLTAAGLTTSRTFDVGFLLAAIPPLAALSYGPAITALLGGIVLVLLEVPPIDLGRPGEIDLATVAFIALLSVAIAWVRERRDAQLVSVRSIAEAVQFAVLPPLPERVGPVRCAGLYRAAQSGTLVGGDLFEVRDGPYGVRAVVGDVQGHGLAAVGTVAALLGAFREAALDQPHLAGVAGRLDRRLVVDAAEVGNAELFATALLLEFTDDARAVRILSCGHPRPLLLRGRTATELRVPAGLPLGLGIAADPPEELTVPLEPGDRLFVVTDGVTESRDGSGAFYPLADRLPVLNEDDLAMTTDVVWKDLVHFAGSVQDDATMLVFAPEAFSPEGFVPEASAPEPGPRPPGGR
ncbi:serine/threonine-protein phosphatase [Streptomyces sp. PSKA54]|uniref:Serine/threonine-protein phosphatase n=1 Tax=Streptomyces himalayensis subsp. aureolus TaxID=2758039 RepID=A0A7W2CW66_9ACTN|nr:PP2C family protein-serine/threonine phosphatase [Streptomyces himalayensis]MBA4860225.1 serine/threonine-protein phosphatase [Streptomyces himalayensis subsp. aureolus]